MSYTNLKKIKWLLFFYTVPSKPVNARIKIWRKLAKSGAVKLKGAVYILPYSEEHYEFLQWLDSEVTTLKGDGTLIIAEKVETMTNAEIAALFNKQREHDYSEVRKTLDNIERKIISINKGGGTPSAGKLQDELSRCLKEFEEISSTDFFSSRAGIDLKKKIRSLEAELQELSGTAKSPQPPLITSRSINDYQGRKWVTREKPFVDRIASAWLIKRFIDSSAIFKFIDEEEVARLDKNSVAFDIRGGKFTHVGDMCTFEVLARSFDLKDRAVKKIAEIVHELDMKDEKYRTPEAKGIEDILTGIRKTGKSDADTLEKGMNVFEMLYASKVS